MTSVREFVELWFDVGKERYTTMRMIDESYPELWFDVGKERYTTLYKKNSPLGSCGLM